MIDQRFSCGAFQDCGLDTPEARKLADLLTEEIETELHKALRPAFEAIVEKLNSLGHNLSPYGDQRAGDLDYHSHNPVTEKLGLRIGLDVVISSGFAHFGSEEGEGPSPSSSAPTP